MQNKSNKKLEICCSSLTLLMSALIAYSVISNCFEQNSTNFQDAALPDQALSIFGEIDGVPFHCTAIDELQPCLNGSIKRNCTSRAVWLGNSQLHAINHYKAGQKNAPIFLFDYLSGKKIDLLAISPPNASLQEFYVLFEYIRSKIKLDYLIIPLVFDDTREDGIRLKNAGAFSDRDSVALLNKTDLGRKLLKNSSSKSEAEQDFAGLELTMQQNVESFFNNWLQEHSQIWRLRPEARGILFLELYKFRNRVFNINAQSKRPKIEGRYINNFNALELILSISQKEGIRTITYIAPIRNDVETPYIQEEYEQFKKDTESLSTKYNTNYINLESIVPAELWGLKDSTAGAAQMELDFMHFQSGGHELLARELTTFFENYLLN